MQLTDRRLTLKNQLIQNKDKQQITYKNIGQLRFAVCFLCMSTFYFGYCLTYLSTIPTQYMIDLFGQITQQPAIKGILIAILPVGAAVGAFTSSFLMRCFTRRNLILLLNLSVIIVEGVIQYQNIYCLLVCRGVQGLLIGNFMALVPIYINQLSPKQIVGGFGVYTQLFVTFGVLFAYIIGLILVKAGVQESALWRVMFALNLISVISVLLAIFFKIIPESPNSLIINGNYQQAKVIIGMFHKEEYIQKVFQNKIKQTEFQTSHKQKSNDKSSLNYSKLAYFLGFQLPFMQQLTGINAIVTQIGSIISQHNPNFGQYSPLILNGVQTIATFFAILAIKYFGRRPIILYGNILLGAFDIILGIFFLFIAKSNVIFWLSFVILIFYNVVYGMTLGPTVWLYVPQIIPAKIVPFATMLNWIGCAISIIILPILNQYAGSQTVFFVFGGISIITFIINVLFLKQTKGQSLQQICLSYSQLKKD